MYVDKPLSEGELIQFRAHFQTLQALALAEARITSLEAEVDEGKEAWWKLHHQFSEATRHNMNIMREQENRISTLEAAIDALLDALEEARRG
jgi:hypothetical protein